jgi:type II restriction enzyme
MVGSSNLTRGGLKDNVEINVILSFDKQDENLETLLDIYARIKYQPTCFVPDSEYIDAYDETIKQAATSTIKIESNKDVRKALEFLRKKEQTLPKPYTAPNTLQGWQKLVYSKLPLTEFNTSFLHQYISEFQRAYPDNQNIEAKIRQVLQQLRDLGLITHVKEGRWIKGQ